MDIHPTRRIVYSASFSGNFRGSVGGCATLFGDYLEVNLEVFVKDFEGKTIQRAKKKQQKVFFLLFKLALDSLFIEGGVPPLGKRRGILSSACEKYSVWS